MFGLLATIAVAVTAVAAQVDDSAIVAKVLTANSQVAKVAAFVRISLNRQPERMSEMYPAE